MHFLQTISLTILCGFLLTGAFQTAHAQPEQEKYTKITLTAQRNHVSPMDEIWIAVQQDIAAGWHTYWKNPGDSGLAASLSWELPENFKIGDIRWPAPHKLSYSDLTDYGYTDQAILLQKLKLPQTLPDGPITLTLKTEILVCNEVCIPEFGTYELTLNAPNTLQQNNTALIAKAQTHIPDPSPWDISYSEHNNNLILTISPQDSSFLETNDFEKIDFFPDNWGLVNGSAPLTSHIENNQLILTQQRDDRALNDIDNIGGILNLQSKNGDTQTISFIATKATRTSTHTDENLPLQTLTSQNTYTAPLANVSIITALFFALIGGMILNLMPCVFPVLSLKALSLAKMADQEHSKARMNGLSYTAGVILSFLAIAGALILFKAAGAQIGWGFQLQNPLVITILAYLLFIIGLNLTGFFEITGHFGNVGQKLTRGNGLTNSFFTGVLATIVATPCTAPFMALAVGYALIQPAPIALLVFATLGLGLALPYLILSFIPTFQRALPKPGPWMNTFRKILAIPMFGFSLWLLSVLAQQIEPAGLLPVFIGLISLALTFWLLTHAPHRLLWRRAAQITAALAFLSTIAFMPAPNKATPHPQKILSFGQEYSPDALSDALIGNDPVFVEMTAAWCITCKINSKIALNTKKTQSLFDDNNVHYLIGDWTNYDPDITKFLKSYGRNGVPIYIYYGPRDKNTGERPSPQLLPQILTPRTVQNIIAKPR